VADITDARLEALLRSAMRTEEVALPVTLRPDDILRRRSRIRGEQIRRVGMRLLLVAAALVLPLAALLAVSGQPSAAPATYRAVILRGAASEPGPGARSDLEVLLVDADGQVDTVAVVPASLFPEDVIPALDGWLTPSGSLGVGAYHGSTGAYATVDLHDLDAQAVVSAIDPRPVPDALPTYSDPVSPQFGELRVCHFHGPEFRRPCHARTDRSVESGSEEDGSLRPWLARALEDVSYKGAAWATDGGIWVLQDDRRGGQRGLSFVHVDSDGKETHGGSFGIAAGQDLYLIGMAPDDSLAAVQTFDDDSIDTMLIQPRTGAAVSVSGALVGFADAADAAALPRVQGSVARLEPLPETVTPAYRELEPLDDQIAPLHAGPLLLVHEASSDGPALDYDTGAVPYADGWALSIECAGPGQLAAEIFEVAGTDAYGSGRTDSDCLYRGGGSFGGPSSELPADQPRQISATVHTEGDVTWRLVVVEVALASPGP
jgi:hypothetical protein